MSLTPTTDKDYQRFLRRKEKRMAKKASLIGNGAAASTGHQCSSSSCCTHSKKQRAPRKSVKSIGAAASTPKPRTLSGSNNAMKLLAARWKESGKASSGLKYRDYVKTNIGSFLGKK